MVWNNLALALSGSGDHVQAAELFRRSLHLDPAQTEVWVSLASAALQAGLLEEAAGACDAAVARDPRHLEAWQVRAMILAAQDDFSGAAQAFYRVLGLGGETAALRANLGVMLFKDGRFRAAETELRAAATLDPDLGEVAEMVQLCGLVSGGLGGDMSQAVAASAHLGQDADRLLKTALLCLDAAGEASASARVALAWLALRPTNLEARHYADAATGCPTLRQPAALVTAHFDAQAATFDDQLVGRLAYQGPDQIADLLSAVMTPAAALQVLELGCGTGLCGAALRPFAAHLAGVDLSPRMLERAQSRGGYDDLRATDLLEALAQARGRWDLIVAADVLPYMGDLKPVWDRAALALKSGGLFAVSIERAASDTYVLRANGRYAHGPSYVSGLAHGSFEVILQVPATLRTEAGAPVAGEYLLMRKI